MSDVRDLYQEVILDHNKSPRNFLKLDPADRSAEGYNPLCGDSIHLFLRMEGDSVKEIGFQGSGCAISKAAASLMTSSVKGKRQAHIQELFEKFHAMITAPPDAAIDVGPLGNLAVFSGVREYPARVKCATLPWHTLKAALKNVKQTVSTEGDEQAQEIPQAPGASLRNRIVDAIRTCFDPEIPVNIYDLGLVYDIHIASGGVVNVKMTLTSPNCPVAGLLIQQVQAAAASVAGVTAANIDVVWDPPWSPARMSEAARLELGMA